MNSNPLYILLADDDEGDRLIFKEAFDELKLMTKVETVNDGIELMKYLNDKALPLPDILFLDLNMPRKNGLECLKEIKQDDRLKNISIAIYSTSASDTDMEATFLNGANIYIHKPNDYTMLKQSLDKAVTVAHLYREPNFKKENFLLRIE
jgi:CheY-like chemotaxis protein